VIVDGKVVIPKGSPVKLTGAACRLGTPCHAGKIVSAAAHGDCGRQNLHDCNKFRRRTLGGKGKRDAGFIGGGAAGGAIIWSAGRRRKGAAIGAAAGAGAGTAGAAATGKKDIEFPAETKLAFTTRAAVAVN